MKSQGNGCAQLRMGCLSGFTNRLAILACDNLLTGDWALVGVMNPPGGSTMVDFTDTDCAGHPARFYRAWNADHDGDHDGMPDWWEHAYSGSGTGVSPTADDDGDGLSNLSEYQHVVCAIRGTT